MDEYVALDARVRGDYIIIPSTFTYTDFDWTDVKARCFLRKSPDSASYVAKFSVTGDASYGTSLTFTPSGTGVAVLAIIASGEATSTWPASVLYGDIEVSRSYPAWGPYTPVRFTMQINSDITR